MKINGGKKYEIVTASSPMVEGKTFVASNKKKFLVGEDIDKYGVLKIKVPSGAIITRNNDYTMYHEEFSGEGYMILHEGLDSIELPDGASVEIADTDKWSCGGGATSWNDLEDKPFHDEERIVIAKERYTIFRTPVLSDVEGYTTPNGCLAANSIIVGDTYIVVFNGVEYRGLAYEYSILSMDYSDAPIALARTYTGDPEYTYYQLAGSSRVNGNLEVIHVKSEKKTLDEKFLPDTVATKSYVEELLGGIENGSY